MDGLVARDVLQMTQGFQPPDFRFPVELLAPIAANALQICEIKSVLPARTRNRIGPARVCEPVTKVMNSTVGIGWLEGLDCHCRLRAPVFTVTSICHYTSYNCNRNSVTC